MSRDLRITAIVVCLLLLAGCHNGPQNAAPDNDPLKGIAPLPPANPAPGTPAQPSVDANRAVGPLPAIPAPTGTTSLAALATGVEQSIDPVEQMRIAAPVSRPDSGPVQGLTLSQPQPVSPNPPSPNAGFPGSNDESPVSLTGQVVPVSAQQPLSANLGTPPPPPPVAQPSLPTLDPHLIPAGGLLVSPFEQAAGLLKARGVTWQSLTQDPNTGDWLFICSIPDPHDPTSVIKFRGDAPGEGGLAAIRVVLAKIDQTFPH